MALFLAGSDANAEPNRPEDERRVDVGVRAGTLTSTTFDVPFGVTAGLEGHYRLSPHVRVGGYVQPVLIGSTSSDSHDYEGQEFSAIRFGARAEVHALPTRVVDPWVGLAAGPFRARRISGAYSAGSQGWGLDLGADAGVDFHLGAGVTLGAVFAFVFPATHTNLFGGRSFAGGTYYSELVIPAPLVRFLIAF